jgi:hypothetical protein
MRNAIRHAAHIVYATVAIHASVLVSDRMKDAFADVGLDHIAHFAEAHFTNEKGE